MLEYVITSNLKFLNSKFVNRTSVKGRLLQCGPTELGYQTYWLTSGPNTCLSSGTATAYTAAFVASMASYVTASVIAFGSAIYVIFLYFCLLLKILACIFLLGFTSDTMQCYLL